MSPRHTRIIHCAWFQGLDAAPPIVRFNLKRWAELNPDYRMNILDQAATETLLADAGIDLKGVAPQALSDMVRVRLLQEHGGVWADASVLPVKPLDDWLPKMTAPSGFFALSRPWPHVVIASWFLAAAPEHPIVRAWWEETRRYWSRPRRLIPGMPASPVESIDPKAAAWTDAYPYNWVQYLLEHRVGLDGSVERALQGEAYMSGVGGRQLREALIRGERNPAALRAEAAKAPIQKLDWRVDWPLDLLEDLGMGGADGMN